MKAIFESVISGNDVSIEIAMFVFVGGFLGILICYLFAFLVDKSKKETISQSGSFNQRHPKLNLMIGMCIVAIVVSFGYMVGCYFLCGLGLVLIKLAIWLKEEISKLDAVIIVALITGAVSIVGVLISSVGTRILEFKKSKQKYLTEKREEAYEDFVEMVYKIQQNAKKPNTYTEQMMIKDLSKFSKKITLWGSPKVVNKWVKFRENGSKQDAGQENLFVMEDIMNEMRKDLGLKKVKKGKLLAFFINDIKDVMKKK